MHISQLPSGSWRVIVQVGKRRRSATAETRAAVEQKGAQLVLELGGEPAATSATVRDLIDLHLAEHPYAPTSLATRASLRQFIPDTFLDRPVARVTPVVIDALYVQLAREGWSVHSIRTLHGMLGSAWKRARRWGWAPSNPIRDANVPAEPAVETISPSTDQAKAFIKAAEAISTAFGLFVRVAAITGSRRGEVCGLQWRDLTSRDVDGLTVHELFVGRSVAYTTEAGLTVGETKTGKKGRRTIAIPAGLAGRLKAYKLEQAEAALKAGIRVGPQGWMFTRDYVDPWWPSSATHLAREARAAAGLDVVKMKHLRNYVATEMLSEGFDPKATAARLGHSRVATTTDRYASSVRSRDVEAAEMLERKLGG